MMMKKFNGFDKNGYLPYGIYNMTMEEFKSIFCKNSPKREEILEEYEKHISEIKNTGYFLDHWIMVVLFQQKKIQAISIH